MKHLPQLSQYVIILSLLFLLGCNRQQIRLKNCNDGKCTYSFEDGFMLEFESDSLLSVSNLRKSVERDMRLFTYTYTEGNTDNPDAWDHHELIYFQLPLDSTSFHYVDNELTSIQLIMHHLAPRISFPFLITEGTASGEKINANTWQIDIDFNIWDEERHISARFKRIE